MYGKCAECTAQNLEEFRHVFGPAALLSPNPGCVVEHGAALESLDEHDSADHEHASVTRAAQNSELSQDALRCGHCKCLACFR